ncbi:phospholipid carrier-dependent glycosyltransferase [Paludisphaera sp.]|uniref:phospholipid carrier-dependent glycosyltransferase n=1 Tax=Paludisphaera sp. TaxID=2017432 RepID=UPI00301BE6E3
MSAWSSIVSLAVVALVTFGGLACGRHALALPRGLPRALAAAVLGWAWITVAMQLLGALGQLRLGWMVGWSGVLALAAGAWATRLRESDPAPPAPAEPTGWEGWVALGLLLWTAIVFGLPSLLLPVKVVSDGPIYHLYFAAKWWKAGGLDLVPVPFGESAATYFPANGDVWFAWLMATWGGDRLARVGQAPFYVMACLAAYGCARELGAGRTASLVATSLFATGGPLVSFNFEANVDTIFMAGYLAAAYFFLRHGLGRDGWPALLFGGLAAGLALGTKSVGNLFVPPLALAGVVAAYWNSRRLRPTLAGAGIMLASVATPSAFWFARNAILTGNPLYPLTLKVGGATLLSGWYDRDAMTQSVYYVPVDQWRALVDILAGVLDARTVPLWLAAVLGAWAIGRGRRPGDGWVWVFAAGAVLNVALYWLFIPYRTQQRFMLQGVGLAVVPLARLLDRGRWLSILATALLALHLLTPQTWPFGPTDADVPWDLHPRIPNAVPSILGVSSAMNSASAAGRLALAGLAAALATWAWSRWRSARRGARTWTVATASALALAGLGALWTAPFAGDPRLLFFPAFGDFYLGWMELDARSGPTGSRVAYAGTNIPYYLMGARLRNDVRYVNVQGPPDWLLHDFHRRAVAEGRGSWPNPRPGWDREEPDFDAWLSNLRDAGIQLLVVTRVNPAEGAHNVADTEGFPIERRWADTRPQVFEPLYGAREEDPWFRLYRVRPPADSR